MTNNVFMIVGARVFILVALTGALAFANSDQPEILRFSPTSGPEGTRVEITGKNLQQATLVRFGADTSVFKVISPEKIVAIVPHRARTSLIIVSLGEVRASSSFPFVVSNDPRVPEEVSYKAGYVNPNRAPPGFNSAMLWGIAIADTRASDYKSAAVEIASTQLTCRVDGREAVLIEDLGKVRGGLYQREPWFAGNRAEPIPLSFGPAESAVVLQVGQRPDRVWHFWSASPRPVIPAGKFEGCTVKARVKISDGALLQMGMDYWRNATIPYAPGNNHEAGASNWYFASDRWQEAVFSDIGGPAF